MKKMQCEVCGSTEIRKVDDDTFECKSCGVQYSKDDVQKLLVEISGSVKVDGPVEVDKSKEIANTLRLAEDAFNGENYVQAYSYYSIVLQTDYNNHYVTFMKGLSSAWQSTLAQNRVGELYESTNTALALLNSQIEEESSRSSVKAIYAGNIFDFAYAYQQLAIKHYDEYRELESSITDLWGWLMSLINTFRFAVAIYDQNMLTLSDAATIFEPAVNNAIDLCNLLKVKRSYKVDTTIDYGFLGPYAKDNWAEKSPTQDVLSFAQENLDYFNRRIYNLPKNIKQRADQETYWAANPQEHIAAIKQLGQLEQDQYNRIENARKTYIGFLIGGYIIAALVCGIVTESFIYGILGGFFGAGIIFLIHEKLFTQNK